MKIIGAGLPRTGTMSMQAALNRLGYPCYHMEAVARNPVHLQIWDDLVSGRAAMNWQTFFQDYEATVEDGWEPLCAFLGCEISQDIPFPHLNAGGATLETKLREIFLVNKVLVNLIAASVLLLGFLVWYFLFR